MVAGFGENDIAPLIATTLIVMAPPVGAVGLPEFEPDGELYDAHAHSDAAKAVSRTVAATRRMVGNGISESSRFGIFISLVKTGAMADLFPSCRGRRWSKSRLVGIDPRRGCLRR